ncbi:MAG: hypothetical protein QW645_04730, partial [Candidatus Bathyarchaeia archaeon]
RIILEASLSANERKFLGAFLLAIVALSASTAFLIAGNRNLSSKLESIRAKYLILNGTHADLIKRYGDLLRSSELLYDRLNKTVLLERKYWAVIGENITLFPKDTIAISIRLDEADGGYMGIHGIDRLEISWIGIHSPDLGPKERRVATVTQYIGDGLGERYLGVKALALLPPQSPIAIREPISPSEAIVRESTSSATFFFENYNYLGYVRPGNWMTLKFFYNADVRLTIRELELYVVGFVRMKLGEAEGFDSAWIGNKVEVEVRRWGSMA